MKKLPEMLFGEELTEALTVLPVYDPSVRSADAMTRIEALEDLYSVYIPMDMSSEIYCKIYTAIARSLSVKQLRSAVVQRNNNFRVVRGTAHRGVLGGVSSGCIIGEPGIGKTATVQRAVEVITGGDVIEDPHGTIIPCLLVQCPFDSSVKGLLIEILRCVDAVTGGDYVNMAGRSRATTDVLIGVVSQVLLNHVCLLVIDEIQNVVSSKNGRLLIGALTQIINNSGITIFMTGTPESAEYMEQAPHLARRALGFEYHPMNNDSVFGDFCHRLMQYQYLPQVMDCSASFVQWMFDHTGGVAAHVISLIHDAQEMAIIEGRDCVDMHLFERTYQERMKRLHTHLERQKKKGSSTAQVKKAHVEMPVQTFNKLSAEKLLDVHGAAGDLLNNLRQICKVEEVSV